MITGLQKQDTVNSRLDIRIDAERLISDSAFRKLDEVREFKKSVDSGKTNKKISWDSAIISRKDSASDYSAKSITSSDSHDSSGVSGYIGPSLHNVLIFQPHENLKSENGKGNPAIIKPLKDGIELPENKLHFDWITSIIILSAILWLVIKTGSKSIFAEFNKFFLFRGINESSSRDTGSLFYWQSTILNFVSFLVMSLFIYCAAAFYEFIPEIIPPFVFLILSLGLVMFGITSRHVICTVTGNLSGKTDVFNEYLMTVYHSYRFIAVSLFFILVLLLYTTFLTPPVYFVSGIIVIVVFYIYRISRLLLIFIKRGISILYLILYLCALEILPVLILLKYFTNLV